MGGSIPAFSIAIVGLLFSKIYLFIYLNNLPMAGDNTTERTSSPPQGLSPEPSPCTIKKY